MKINVVITVLIFSGVTVIWGQPVSLSLPSEKIQQPSLPAKTPKLAAAKQCGVETKGLIFCTTTPVVEVVSGQKVTIEISLENVSSEIMTVQQIGGFSGNYEVVIEDSSGSRIYSKLQRLQKKYQEGTISPVEQAQLLPSGNGPFTLDLAPQKELKW